MKFFEVGQEGILGKTVSVIQKRPKGQPVFEYIFEGDLDVGQEMAAQMNGAKETGTLKTWLRANQDKFERYSI